MRWTDALEIIEREEKPSGFRVHFEKVEVGILATDYFPDSKETPIASEESAWRYAMKFAANTFGKYVNIYVVDSRYCPVKGYDEKIIINR